MPVMGKPPSSTLLALWGLKKPDDPVDPNEMTTSEEEEEKLGEPASDTTEYEPSFMVVLRLASSKLMTVGDAIGSCSDQPKSSKTGKPTHPLLLKAREMHLKKKNSSKPTSIANEITLDDQTIKTACLLDTPTGHPGQLTSSFIVTLKAPSLRLISIASSSWSRSSSEAIEPKKEPGAVHPFFVRAKPFLDDTNKTPNEHFELVPDDSSSPPPKSPAPIHPFFTNRKEKHVKKEQLEPQVPALAQKSFSAPIHPFFSQTRERRPASRERSKEGTPLFSNSFINSQPLFSGGIGPPWTIQHVRGLDNDFFVHTKSVPSNRSKGKYKCETIADEDLVYRSWPHKSPTFPVSKADRLFMSSTDIRNLAARTVTPANANRLDYLIKSSGLLKSFDKFTCEQQSWVSKYAPTTRSHVITASNNYDNVHEWIKKKMNRLRKKGPRLSTKPKKRRKIEDDFVVSDEDELSDLDSDSESITSARSKFLVLCGPPGSGKTATVMAVARDLGAFAFEVNSSNRRAGRDVMALLEGVGQSHLVHSSKTEILKLDTIILLEEVDNLFDDENSFWSAIEKFAETSRRPVVITCNDPATLPEGIINGTGIVTYLDFAPGNSDLAVDCLWLIALNEGHWLQKPLVDDLWELKNHDFRKCIEHLQFYCQFGVGWRKSGVDWYIDSAARTKMEKEHGDSVRVISRNTYIGMPVNQKTDITVSEQSLKSYEKMLSTASDLDVLQSAAHSSIQPERLPPKNQPLGYQQFSEMPLKVAPHEFEVDMTRYIEDKLPRGWMVPIYAGTAIDLEAYRDAFSFLSYQYVWNRVGVSTSYNAIDCVSSTVMATEVGPTIRAIAAEDLRRESIKQNTLAGNAHLRQSKRSLTSLGVEDCTKYFGEGIDLEFILETGFYKF